LKTSGIAVEKGNPIMFDCREYKIGGQETRDPSAVVKGLTGFGFSLPAQPLLVVVFSGAGVV
jgi:hypothetical protein